MIKLFFFLFQHPCDICGLMFNVANIPRHKMAVHSNANYSCFICNVPYNSIRSLRSHFSSVHFEHKLEEKKCSRCNITVPVKYIDAHNEVCIRFELNFFLLDHSAFQFLCISKTSVRLSQTENFKVLITS